MRAPVPVPPAPRVHGRAGLHRAKSSLLLLYGDSWPRCHGCHVCLAPSGAAPRRHDKSAPRHAEVPSCEESGPVQPASPWIHTVQSIYVPGPWHGTDKLAWHGLAWTGRGMAWQSPEELEGPPAHGSHHRCVPCGFLVQTHGISPCHTTTISFGLLVWDGLPGKLDGLLCPGCRYSYSAGRLWGEVRAPSPPGEEA